MHRNTWKSGERRIASQFKTKRTPLSGGNSGHTQSDTLHSELFIEVKHSKKYPKNSLWKKVEELSKKEKKIPLIIFIKKSYPNPLVLCRVNDIKKITKFML